MFPSLEILDGFDKEGEEIISEDEEEYGGQEGDGDAEGEGAILDDEEYGEEDFDDAEYGEDDGDYDDEDDEEAGAGLGKR
jgi:hypothetical protein